MPSRLSHTSIDDLFVLVQLNGRRATFVAFLNDTLISIKTRTKRERDLCRTFHDVAIGYYTDCIRKRELIDDVNFTKKWIGEKNECTKPTQMGEKFTERRKRTRKSTG